MKYIGVGADISVTDIKKRGGLYYHHLRISLMSFISIMKNFHNPT